jgi:flagellar hook-basal body complex protein FliE
MLELAATTGAGAYSRIAAITSPLTQQNIPVTDTGGAEKPQGFGAMVNSFIGDVAHAGRSADNQAAMSVKGKGDIVDMVTAIAESEVALETLVSVRDRAIAAYEEIMRMPI